MSWFRRKPDADSLDPQYLLEQAHAQSPVAPISTGAFRLTIEDVFTITGRGTVVTGRVDSGTVSTGDTLRLTRTDGSTRDIEIAGVEMFRKIVDTATAGDNVGLLLRRVPRDEIARGDVLER